MLRRLTVDYVKVDRSVVSGAMDSPGARGVLAAILAFAQQSGAAVIAEGVENEEMLDFVREMGMTRITERPRIHAAQGYHLGRPEVGLDLLQHSHA
jgi:EAL domain-containing protein (putative c-di-GMP-specific phosphodiesterase class I)